MELFADVATLIIDGNRGIYIAQDFASYLVTNSVPYMGVDKNDIRVLLLGPDHPVYNEVWDHVSDNIVFQDEDGDEFRLYQNGDLLSYPNDADIDWDNSF